MKNRFQRKKPTREYRKFFHILTEGKNPEHTYLLMLQKRNEDCCLKLLPISKKTSALQILSRIKRYVKDNMIKDDEVWVVLDVDDNSKEDLEVLLKWRDSCSFYGVALSNPKFEYWLLQHFESGAKVYSSQVCNEKLKQHLPNYSKDNLSDIWSLEDKIEIAISFAKKRHKNIVDWFYDCHTTVFELAEKILNAGKNKKL